MAEATKVDEERLRAVAKRIRDLADGGGVFAQLADARPNAGMFDVAEWLEDLFGDRRDAIGIHRRYLNSACEEIADGLEAIASAFAGVDRSNAEAMRKAEVKGKKAVKGMAEGDFEPKLLKDPKTYDSGDDEETGDHLTVKFDGSDVEVTADVLVAPGTEDFRFHEVGPEGNRKKVDLHAVDAFEGDEFSGLPYEEQAVPGTTDPEPEPEPQANHHPTGVHFDPTREPTGGESETFTTDPDEVPKWKGREFVAYRFDNEPQKDQNGHDVYWYRGEAYLDTDGSGFPDTKV